MQPAPAKTNGIRRSVNLRQVLKRWRHHAATSSSTIPPDVPSGHVAVYIGATGRRVVVRATYLNHPVFKKLLAQAEEEFGFANQGPLVIPCDEAAFQEALNCLSRSSAPFVGNRCYGGGDFYSESMPLAHDKSIYYGGWGLGRDSVAPTQ